MHNTSALEVFGGEMGAPHSAVKVPAHSQNNNIYHAVNRIYTIDGLCHFYPSHAKLLKPGHSQRQIAF